MPYAYNVGLTIQDTREVREVKGDGKTTRTGKEGTWTRDKQGERDTQRQKNDSAGKRVSGRLT